jgi:beta-lactam-binding protein with PASTA domain
VNVRRKRIGSASIFGGLLKPRAMAAVAIVAVIAFGVGYGLTAMAFASGGAGADVALVPDVRELTLADAERRLSRAGFAMVVSDSFPNVDIPQGAVLAQSPLPGQEVSSGAEVSVIISSGQPRPIIPDVSSMSVSMAIRSLEAAGFTVSMEDAPGEGTPGAIVGTVPEAGTPLPVPASIVLRVGASPDFLNMPLVLGMPEDSAVVSLEAAGLRVTEVRYEADAASPPYRVIFQNPAPGDSVDFQGAVRLRVSMPVVGSGSDRPVDGAEPERADGDADATVDADAPDAADPDTDATDPAPDAQTSNSGG